jgi:hypothetical protein
VADVPLLSPEKNASAIEQKNTLVLGTSVKGSVMLAPPQVPVSACNRSDTAVIITIAATSRIVRFRTLVFVSFLFMGFS